MKDTARYDNRQHEPTFFVNFSVQPSTLLPRDEQSPMI